MILFSLALLRTFSLSATCELHVTCRGREGGREGGRYDASKNDCRSSHKTFGSLCVSVSMMCRITQKKRK